MAVSHISIRQPAWPAFPSGRGLPARYSGNYGVRRVTALAGHEVAVPQPSIDSRSACVDQVAEVCEVCS